MVLYVESNHAYLWMGVWFTARYLNRAKDKILFFPRVCIILGTIVQTQALLSSKLLIKGLIKTLNKVNGV